MPSTQDDVITIDDIYSARGAVATIIEKELRNLLENKHLYQSIRIQSKDVENAVLQSITHYVHKLEEHAKGLSETFLTETYWRPNNPGQRSTGIIPPVPTNENLTEILDKILITLEFNIVSIKTYCSNCSELSPMNLKKTTDALASIQDDKGYSTENFESVYTFAFQCQNCRVGIETFIVARKKDKLTLVGRSPMEKVNIPYMIPKNQKKYYSSAIIAFNSGQILAALFMLRTFVEQFTRECAPPGIEHADNVLDSYMDSLPSDFKKRFPSLKKIYSDLSAAIHKAEESFTLFEVSARDIEKHFEARRLFELN